MKMRRRMRTMICSMKTCGYNVTLRIPPHDLGLKRK